MCVICNPHAHSLSRGLYGQDEIICKCLQEHVWLLTKMIHESVFWSATTDLHTKRALPWFIIALLQHCQTHEGKIKTKRIKIDAAEREVASFLLFFFIPCQNLAYITHSARDFAVLSCIHTKSGAVLFIWMGLVRLGCSVNVGSSHRPRSKTRSELQTPGELTSF